MKPINILIVALLLLSGVQVHAQQPDNYPPDNTRVTIKSTNLPIVWIEVGGAMIEREERIPATMKIIHNGDGMLNYADTVAHPGQRIDYEGNIGLRYRGNSSFNSSDKKPYQFHTLEQPLNVSDKKKKVSILGMGKDNKWGLLAPYSDRSMIRDLLAFELARPWMEYTPQGRLCEVYLDGTYYGIYVLCELVSKGKHRLNLDDPGESGDALTGGYLMEVDCDDDTTYTSKYPPVNNSGYKYSKHKILFQYKSPDFEDMTQTQIDYINGRIDEMEDAFASKKYKDPEVGYRKYIDVTSFIDYQLSMELGHNVDAYRLSAKFFKRRDSIDSRFKMVVWDMNLAYGNARHNKSYKTDTWMYRSNPTLVANGEDNLIPFWWYKLNKDTAYTNALKARWALYRTTNVSYKRLMATIDSLTNEVTRCGAIDRNSKAWPRWGEWVWPNYYVSIDYEDEIDYLKQWLTDRIAWMDEKLGFLSPPEPEYEFGDVNADGQSNIADVNVLIDIILGGEYDDDFLDRADINGDDEISIADVMALIDYLLQYGV